MIKLERLENKNNRFISVSEYKHPLNFVGQFHTQNFFEISFIISGKGHYETIKGKNEITKTPVSSDTMLFWDGRTPHRVVDDPGFPLHQVIICFGYRYPAYFSMLDDLVGKFKKSNPFIFDKTQTSFYLKPKIRKILYEFNNDKTGKIDSIKALIILLLVEMNRILGEKSLETNKNTDIRIMHAIEHIKSNYDQTCYISEYAKNFSLSTRHFSELFKKTAGKTFIHFVNEYRISVVKKMLKETDKKIATIAFEAGYDNLSLFNKTFKDICKVTPQDFRETQKE